MMKVKSRRMQKNTNNEQSAGTLPWTEPVFQELADNISDGVYYINTDGYFIFVNKSLSQRTGIRTEQFPHLHFLNFVDPAYRDRAKENFQRVMEGKEGIPYELKYNSKNGQVRIVEVHSRPVFVGGKVVGSLGISRDITTRKIAEEALQKSLELYDKLISASPDAIVQTDMNAKIFMVNDVGVQLSGYSSAEEIIGQNILSFIIPEDRERANENLFWQPQRRIGPTAYSMIARDGRRIILEVNGDVLRNADAVPYGRVFICRDITDRKQSEEALRVSEERFRLLSEAAFEAIAIHEEGVLLHANEQYFKMFGYEPGEALGKEMMSLTIAPESIEFAKKQVTEDCLGPYEFIGLRKDGARFPIEANIRKMAYEGRNVRFAAIRDITNHKQAEVELERHRKHLEDIVKERTAELESKSITLQELNTALKVLLKQREDDKKDMEERFVMNMQNLVLPFVEQMKKGHLGAGQQANLDIIETHLHNIATPLLKNIRQFNFTPKEIKVAMLVKEGKSTKEIAEMLKISTESIDVHRKNMRKKLGLSNRKANLQSHLVSLEQ